MTLIVSNPEVASAEVVDEVQATLATYSPKFSELASAHPELVKNFPTLGDPTGEGRALISSIKAENPCAIFEFDNGVAAVLPVGLPKGDPGTWMRYMRGPDIADAREAALSGGHHYVRIPAPLVEPDLKIESSFDVADEAQVLLQNLATELFPPTPSLDRNRLLVNSFDHTVMERVLQALASEDVLLVNRAANAPRERSSLAAILEITVQAGVMAVKPETFRCIYEGSSSQFHYEAFSSVAVLALPSPEGCSKRLMLRVKGPFDWHTIPDNYYENTRNILGGPALRQAEIKIEHSTEYNDGSTESEWFTFSSCGETEFLHWPRDRRNGATIARSEDEGLQLLSNILKEVPLERIRDLFATPDFNLTGFTDVRDRTDQDKAAFCAELTRTKGSDRMLFVPDWLLASQGGSRSGRSFLSAKLDSRMFDTEPRNIVLSQRVQEAGFSDQLGESLSACVRHIPDTIGTVMTLEGDRLAYQQWTTVRFRLVVEEILIRVEIREQLKNHLQQALQNGCSASCFQIYGHGPIQDGLQGLRERSLTSFNDRLKNRLTGEAASDQGVQAGYDALYLVGEVARSVIEETGK